MRQMTILERTVTILLALVFVLGGLYLHPSIAVMLFAAALVMLFSNF